MLTNKFICNTFMTPGGYGALSNGYGQTLVPIAAYGGQGDGSAITYTTSALANARAAVATTAFHPYRR